MDRSLNYIADFHKNLDHAKIMLIYNGTLSKDIVEAFISRLKSDIEKADVPKKEKKRFFSIVVECIQNLSKHGNVSDINDAHFLVLVEKEKNILKISTGNVIPNTNEKVIIDLIDMVNQKDRDELQRLYKEGITHNTLNENGQASLGLIDIARKSSQKLTYQFDKIDNDNSFFLFQTQVHVL